MNIKTAKFIYSSELFLELGFEKLMSDFFSSDLRFTFGDLNISLITLREFLEEIEYQFQFDEKTEAQKFITKVKNRENYDPELFVDLEN